MLNYQRVASSRPSPGRKIHSANVMANIARSVATPGMSCHVPIAGFFKLVWRSCTAREMMVCTIVASTRCCSPDLRLSARLSAPMDVERWWKVSVFVRTVSENIWNTSRWRKTNKIMLLLRPTTWQPDANPNGFLLTAAEARNFPWKMLAFRSCRLSFRLWIHYDILKIYIYILWYIMIYYDILWYIMIYYDILWYIMI